MSTTAAALPGAHDSLERLLELRRALRQEMAKALTPAVSRTLELADEQLFLALGYLGYADELFPQETA